MKMVPETLTSPQKALSPSTMFPTLRPGFIVFAILASIVMAEAKDYRLTLSSTTVDRAGQLVSFSLPKDAPRSPGLRDANGTPVTLQVDDRRVARFMVAWHPAGMSPVYTLTSISPTKTKGTGIAVSKEDGDLSIAVEGKTSLGYRMDREKLPRADIEPEYKRAGYLFPILSPSGKSVADDYPAQHVHHHGIWTPWTKTSFQGRAPDFWNMGAKTGTVEFVGLERTWQGPVFGGFSSRHRMVDLSAPSPVTALDETWEVSVYSVSGARVPVRLFDLTLVQTCATSDPLILPEYHYGGLGYRGPGAWIGPTNSQFLTSNGETDRVKAHASRATWICQYGVVDGGFSGVTLMGHPGNFRAPQPLRVHPKEPFVCFAPSQLGEWRIEPGKPYVARYRFVVADGAPDGALLEAYWQGYAQPAVATLAAK